MPHARFILAGLLGLTACDGGTDVSPDALAEHCEARCDFQATCVPELRDVIGECIRQCRASFEDPEKYVRECEESDVRLPNDPTGPYLLETVVVYQQCLIRAGCEPADDACPESRELCLDGLDPQLICNRNRNRAYQTCQDDYAACLMSTSNGVCEMRIQRCYQDVSTRYPNC